MVVSVNRGTGQTEEECVWQSRAHLRAEVALLRAVGLVHKQDDVAAGVYNLAVGKVAELENSGDENFPHLNLFLKFFFRRDAVNIGYLGPGEVSCDLVFEVDAVVDNDDCGRI